MQRIDILQEHWSPTTRVLAGAGGASLVTYALARRSPLAAALGLAGATVLLRAAANVSIARLAGRRGPYIHALKTRRCSGTPR